MGLKSSREKHDRPRPSAGNDRLDEGKHWGVIIMSTDYVISMNECC